MIEMSSEVIRDLVWCFWGIGGILGHNELVGEAGGNQGGGDGLRNETGQLGLGGRQFGESEYFFVDFCGIL